MSKEYINPNITAFKVFVNNKNLNNESELIEVIERGLKLNISPNVIVSITKKTKPVILSIIDNLRKKRDTDFYNKIFNEGHEKGYFEGIAAGEKKSADYYKKASENSNNLQKKIDSLKGIIEKKEEELTAFITQREKDRRVHYCILLAGIIGGVFIGAIMF